jgi:hypothetical protein
MGEKRKHHTFGSKNSHNSPTLAIFTTAWNKTPAFGKLYKIDSRLMDSFYCYLLLDYVIWEESKRKHRRQFIGKNSAVKQQMQRVTESCECKFTVATLLQREGKTVKLTIIRKERCSLP